MRWVRFLLAAALVSLSATLGAGRAEARRAQLDINGPSGNGPGQFVSGSINTGDTVVWQNNDPDTAHTVSGPGFSSGNIAPAGGRAEHTFNSPGTFEFHCTIHPEMTGVVQISGQPVATTSPPAPPPPPPPASSATTRAGSATTRTTVRGSATTVAGETTTTVGFDALATTTSTEPATTTTGDLAINEDDGGGSNTGAIAAITVAILAVVTGGGYLLYRLRSAP